MSASVQTARVPADGRGVLNLFKQLRRFEGEPADFWPAYTRGACGLCHAPYAFVLSQPQTGAWECTATAGDEALFADHASHLVQLAANLAPRAREQDFAQEPLRLPSLGFGQPVLLVVALETGDVDAVLALLVDRRQPQQFNDAVLRSQLIADVPRSYFQSALPVVVAEAESAEPFADVLDLLALMLRQKKFVSASMLLVNDLAARLGCARVSLGWQSGDYVVPVAISHMERFEPEADVCKQLQAVFEESFDQDEELSWPQAETSGAIMAAHENYALANRCVQLVSLPLRHDGEPLAVLTCERLEVPLSDQQLRTLRLALDQVTPWLRELKRRDGGWRIRAALWLQERASVWLGPERTLIKVASVMGALCALYLVFGTWTYRVDVTATLATDQVAFLTAPFDGYVHEVKVHAGDRVKKDDLLLTLDTQELSLKELEANADVLRYSREAEKARASGAYADMQIAQARAEQARASLERVRYFLRQATLRAPFESVVVEGDKEELLGAPLNKGDTVFKLAQLSDLYAELRLDERDIGAVKVGDRGTLALLSRPEHRIAVEVTDIVPVAEVSGARGNTFVLKARFVDGAEDWWRPGMSGLAKIEVGERSILWLMTHRTAEFLRMQLWW